MGIAIWSPQRCRGLRLVKGSCGISAICAPRTPFHPGSELARDSRFPPMHSSPAAVTPCGSRPLSALAVSDLPLPDSPTTASVSPACT